MKVFAVTGLQMSPSTSWVYFGSIEVKTKKNYSYKNILKITPAY